MADAFDLSLITSAVSTMAWLMASAHRQVVHAVVLGTALTALAPADARADESKSCSFGAFIEERDPAGVNVRSAPSSTATILGTLPPTWFSKTDSLQERVEVDVISSRQGWFQIRKAVDFSGLSARKPRPTYAEEGWISGNKMLVKSQASVGRSAPRSDSSVLMQVGEGETLDSDALMDASRPVDCSGHWVRLEFRENAIPKDLRATMRIHPQARQGVKPGRFRVWVNRICDIQETTCDGWPQQDE
ncbi:SH3 domain-containing protein [Roseateles amylovorans]|uniref:SH3 domain-containing protein n=1 Tax=Roseateles amylovorans TaxID=2978473 RepID=A0ABY6B5R1_9BURK|nr:SH3 domain-containing protein [Roseateles amylovorans]UXH80703.1 SH3 domain-containing protein [Roseateles amylovorans]